MMPQLVMTAQSLKVTAIKQPALYAATDTVAVYDATAGNDGGDPEAYGWIVSSQLFMLPQLAVCDATSGNDSAEPEAYGQ